MWSGVLKNSVTSKIYQYRVISRTQVQNGTTTKLIKNFIKLYLNESLMNKNSKQQESIDFGIIISRYDQNVTQRPNWNFWPRAGKCTVLEKSENILLNLKKYELSRFSLSTSLLYFYIDTMNKCCIQNDIQPN